MERQYFIAIFFFLGHAKKLYVIFWFKFLPKSYYTWSAPIGLPSLGETISYFILDV